MCVPLFDNCVNHDVSSCVVVTSVVNEGEAPVVYSGVGEEELVVYLREHTAFPGHFLRGGP